MTNRFLRIVVLVALLAGSLNAAVPAVVAQDEGSWDGGAGSTGGGAPPQGDCPDPLIRPCRPDGITLFEPLDDEGKELKFDATPLSAFYEYFRRGWPWVLGIASGIAVLQAVWGGVLIMTSMDRDGGKEKIEWALGGMVMIALAGFILRFLNPIFYT
jgi:hypothetical protein